MTGEKAAKAAKKKRTLLLCAAIILLFLAGSFVLRSVYAVSIAPNATVRVRFVYDTVCVNEDLTAKEAETIRQTLHKKHGTPEWIYGEPACGFSEDIAFKTDGKTYEMACDDCPIIRVKTRLGYSIIDLSEDEAKTLRDIFRAHGGYFPCV